MPTLKGLTMAEMERIKHCQGCVHLGMVGGGFGCCDYIFHAGKRRPCPFGDGCTVKQIGKRKRAYTVTHIKNGLPRERKPGSGVYERQLKWDAEKGRELYEAGVPLRQIAAEVGLNHDSLRKYAKRKGWVRPEGHFASWDTELGRLLYESGVPAAEISKRLGISPEALRAAARRRSWKRKRGNET